MTGRFMTEDPIRDGLNWYTYANNNPVRYIDPSGHISQLAMLEKITNALVVSSDSKYSYIPDYPKAKIPKGTEVGTLADFWFGVTLGATRDKNNVYHIAQDYWQSIGVVGYNDFYDWAFDKGVSVLTLGKGTVANTKFEFNYDNTDFVLWAWKGDYVNLGAGAELGIYSKLVGGHYMTRTDYSMVMTLSLELNGEEIINWNPDEDNWWINGFNPAYKGVKAENMIATYSLAFNNKDMYNAFYNTWYGVSKKWKFDSESYTATLTF